MSPLEIWSEEDLRKRYIQTLETLCKSLPAGCVSLQVDESIEKFGKQVTVVLVPTNPDSARIHADLVVTYGAYLSFGRGAVFEIPLKGKRYTGLGFLAEVEALCKAVLQGRFEEDVVTVNGRVIGATGSVTLESGQGKVTDSWTRIAFDLFRKKVRSHHVYQPYSCAGSTLGTYPDGV